MLSQPDNMSIDATDRRLIALLRENARLPITSLAHALSLSRASTYARLARLERDGVIAGYTLKLGADYDRRLIRANVMLHVEPKLARAVERQLSAMPELVSLHAISGEYDMMALVEADSVAALNDVIDHIGECDGVANTNSAILLSTRVSRNLD
jgi:DNA-binding Lrp family transcriptional regulator